MKNIILILVGIIIIGSGSTLLIQRSNPPAKTTILNEINGVDFVGMKATDLSTDTLNIVDLEGKILTVASKKNPEMHLFIDIQDEGFNQLAIHDKNNTYASFMDKDSDGIWDFRDFSTDNITYAYGRGTGYPDTIIEGSNVLVRIDGQYHEMLNKNEKQYISIGGRLIEIDAVKWGYFKIKESEPAI
jgi:hypothetical protein